MATDAALAVAARRASPTRPICRQTNAACRGRWRTSSSRFAIRARVPSTQVGQHLHLPHRPLLCASPHAWQLEAIGAGRFPRCSSNKLSDFQSPRTRFWLSGFRPLGWPGCRASGARVAPSGPTNPQRNLAIRRAGCQKRPRHGNRDRWPARPRMPRRWLLRAGKASCPFPRRVGRRLRGKSVGLCAICIVLRSL